MRLSSLQPLDRLHLGYEALNRGDLSEVAALVASDIVWESETGDAGRGRESFRRFLQSWVDNFDGFRAEPREVIERGQHLVAVVDLRGRGRGSGVEVAATTTHVWTISAGHAVRWRAYLNREVALAAIASSAPR